MRYCCVCLVLVFFSSGFGQLIIKNNAETEIMRVNDDGNVGIGTHDPAQKLHIEDGNLRIGVVGNGIELQGQDGNYNKILFITPNDGGIDMEANATILSSIGSNAIHLFPNSASVNGLTIDYKGRVGIDQSIPQDKLHVQGGNIRLAGSTPAFIIWDETSSNWASIQNGGDKLRFHSQKAIGFLFDIDNNDTNSAFVIGTNHNSFHDPEVDLLFKLLENGNIGLGGIDDPTYPIHSMTGAYLSNGGAWTNASSREYKENIQDLSLQEAIETCMALEPKKYNYKTNPEEYLGFIAEDVPDLVASADRKGLSPMDITAILIKVVQEQQKRIDQLETIIQSIPDLY